MPPTYLFILSPPFSGSTLLWKLVSTSVAVSSLPAEGQFLPEVAAEMRADPWNRERRLPWADIKQVWDRHWDHDKPLLVEKSPPNLIRTADLVAHFDPVAFVVMVRNPYALCEGLMRRNGWAADFAAHFALMALQQQAANVESLGRVVRLTYEELVADPAGIAARLETFLPQLGRLDVEQRFEIHSIDGLVERGIVDLNQKKIDQLTPANLTTINAVLRTEPAVMAYWNYAYLDG